MKQLFTEEQIIKILKEHAGGNRAADIVREYNITERTFYRWKPSMAESKQVKAQ